MIHAAIAEGRVKSFPNFVRKHPLPAASGGEGGGAK
jgi:hypothetical protein